jgi:hypothetical protein
LNQVAPESLQSQQQFFLSTERTIAAKHRNSLISQTRISNIGATLRAIAFLP